jgi:hypothetical protein
MVRRLLIWLLTRIQQWTSRWLERVTGDDAPVAVDRRRARPSPPPHWRDLVAARAPHLLDPGDDTGRFAAPPPPPRTAAPTRPLVHRRASAPIADAPHDRPSPSSSPAPAHVGRRSWTRRVSADSAASSHRVRTSATAIDVQRVDDVVAAERVDAPDAVEFGRRRTDAADRVELDGARAESRRPAPVDETRRWPRLLAADDDVDGAATRDEPEALRWPALPSVVGETRFTSRLANHDRRAKADAEQRGTRWNA